jgi:hypothetical protein
LFAWQRERSNDCFEVKQEGCCGGHWVVAMPEVVLGDVVCCIGGSAVYLKGRYAKKRIYVHVKKKVIVGTIVLFVPLFGMRV